MSPSIKVACMELPLMPLLFCVVGCSMNASNSSEPSNAVHAGDLPRVEVSLGASIREVHGMALSDRLGTEAVGGADLLRAHQLTIRLADGRSLSMAARSVSLITLNGTLKSAYVRRPMTSLRFKEVVEDMRSTMTTLGLEPTERMAKQIATWGEQNPGREEGASPDASLYKTGMELIPGSCVLDIRVKPDPEGGWYYLMIFATRVGTAESCP